jgi:hypothetical protein
MAIVFSSNKILNCFQVCLYRQLLFVFGGTGYPFGQTISNDLFILDLKRLHWKRYQFTNEQLMPVYGAVEFFYMLQKIFSLLFSFV